ncbi:MAG: bifunctional precorrin-2 dehydrogenase/sirohydrochlorin ferrochelatase [Syntrophomonadaceae bacterium]|nr:bifunctional precorrin-2 dehydrogenase/sirohydrochlorin ferrochelatase [Syntrophomonadaceae bacterium]
MDHLYPIYLKLNQVKCLVIGGGSVAERKVTTLLQYGARVLVIAPDITIGLNERVLRGEIEYWSRSYQSGDLDNLEVGRSLVFVATNQPEVNHQVFRECQARGILVNVVDDPVHCSFFVPAIVRRGSLCLAISTEGKSPMLARRIREKLEKEFGPEYEEFLNILGECRQKILDRVSDERQRRKLFEQLLDMDLLELIREKKTDLVKERVSQCLSLWLD